MNKNNMVRVILCVSSLLLLSSCGSTNSGSGVGVFDTVTVAASVTTPLEPSKVFAGAVCTDGQLTGGAMVEDTYLSITLTSTAYPSNTTNGATPSTTTGLPVEITSYTLSFKPENGGPAIPSMGPVGYSLFILGGGSATATIPITTDAIKNLLQSNAQLQQCATTSYTYSVTIAMLGTETDGANAIINAYTSVTFTNNP